MIEFTIFDEFFENGRGALCCHFTSSYHFFQISKKIEKKITHQYQDGMYPWKKLEFLEHF